MTCLAAERRNTTGPEDGLPPGRPVFSFPVPLAICGAFLHKPAMLQINDLTFRMMGRPAVRGRHRCRARRNEGRARRPQRHGQDHPVQDDDGRTGAGKRLDRTAQGHPDRPGGAGSARHRADAARGGAGRRSRSARRCSTEAETATDPDRIAAIHMFASPTSTPIPRKRAPARFCTASASTRRRRPCPCSSFSGGWRMRVALAAVLFSRARSPDARRADQLSRPRRHAVAGKLRAALSAYRRSSSAMTAIS